MPKAKLVSVHVNSKGRLQLLFQKIISGTEKFYFVPLDGKLKTAIYNRGFLDGRKRKLKCDRDVPLGVAKHILVIPGALLNDDNFQQGDWFVGTLSLELLYMMSNDEAARFIENECSNCEYQGQPSCFNLYQCYEDDRDQYMDSPWFDVLRTIRKERKRSKAFPG
ncbi:MULTISPECIES: hypothetical protein [Paenibacillus]|uniref:Uncharacterized protein n=1 Tax=Paenibacillus vandeheii TaxID=3035917 RepID=A0ABT8JHB1_9BACL|nr:MULTISPECIES: hypothetical protein [Paenibacillus]KGP81942.1 hypothetical protein P364_0114050 [Paenibacillus sp. MAEPY2]KGP86028.1 hypothetical protein P363_0119525 [Paenibacillus sp. MAEPY1]MDN4603857.1 hypothetical protein [Paenibacillus vandeheii]